MESLITNTSRRDACRYPVTRARHGKITGMAHSRRTYKGDRGQVLAPIAAVVYSDLDERAISHSTSISQLCSDLLAIATGHPELARELPQTALLPTPPMCASSAPIAAADSEGCRDTKMRVPMPVYNEIRRRAVEHSTTAGQAAADLLAIVTGHFDAVRQLDEEVLQLAM
ncbi:MULTISPECIES: hypothetical protein [Mycobacterium]|uniref:hypothetical protein n=1 Tax=Mycobacterium TaxID=1763 RepID=UPI001F2B67D3|nr:MULTISPECIES: hypothetical protein [Mycobacterium]